jgi:hypothetical protein
MLRLPSRKAARSAVFQGLKERAAKPKGSAKKSEILRAGIAALHGMNDKVFLSMLNSVASLKTGRPKGLDKAVQPAKKSAKWRLKAALGSTSVLSSLPIAFRRLVCSLIGRRFAPTCRLE